jgi:hypothetical protein
VARHLIPHRKPDECFAMLREALSDPVAIGRVVPDLEIRNAVNFGLRNSYPLRSGRAMPAPPLSATVAAQEATPAWSKANPDEIGEVLATSRFSAADLWEKSPVQFMDGEAHTDEILDALFPGNPLLWAGMAQTKGDTLARGAWRGNMHGLEVMVPSPMTATEGFNQQGNPSPRTKANTGPRRFLVLEGDSLPADDQAAILWHLSRSYPLALVLHSGGKSLHGWFFVDGRDEKELRAFMERAVRLGCDSRTWPACQPIRIPDGRRGGKTLQGTLYFNPFTCN